MYQHIRFGFLFLLLLFFPSGGRVVGQGTIADYARIGQLKSLTANKVFRTQIEPHWLPDGEHLWYRVRTGANSHEFVFVDLQEQMRVVAFDQQSVARQLTSLTGEEIDGAELPFKRIQFSDDLGTIFFRYEGRDWKVRRDDSVLSLAEEEELNAAMSLRSASLRPSVDRGGELHVEFVNESSTEIRTLWIDRRGRRVPYQKVDVGESATQHTFAGHVWLIVNADGDALEVYEADPGSPRVVVDGKSTLDLPKQAEDDHGRQRPEAVSPDGKFIAFVRDGQVFVHEKATGAESHLASSTDDENFFDDGRFYWSPDSRYLAALEVQRGDEREITLVESAPKDQLQPKLHKLSYAKPGDRIRTETPHLFDIAEMKEVSFNAQLYATPWSLTDYQWREDSSEFAFLYNERGHQTLRIVGLNPNTGRALAILEEHAETFFDYTNKVFWHLLDAEDELVWMSERDGWNHLYLYDTDTGDVINQITEGEWVVRSIEDIDEKVRQVWFRASGIVPGQDPYFVHHCRIDLDGSNLVILTEGNGTHAIAYSPNRKYFVDTYSRVDLPEVTAVRRTRDGSLACPLEEGDCDLLLATGWKAPVPFSAKGRDGQTDIYGVIYLPTNFDADKKYPIIENIYAGPHGSFVPKEFAAFDHKRALAELGFIVVQIDGMGTSNRSKAFHDVCWKNLGDSGFPDRILWMQEAANTYPQMDLSRVGVYGGSAGGQSALRALLAHGDFYKVAVSDCGCHDNRMDKIWWNEQWMGWPLGSHYEDQSNVTNAHQLTGELLLIVGELDRNVDPASTMQVVDALIRADKDFDLLVVPGGGHGIGSQKYGLRRTRDFFVRHLHGIEPRTK